MSWGCGQKSHDSHMTCCLCALTISKAHSHSSNFLPLISKNTEESIKKFLNVFMHVDIGYRVQE